MRSLEERFWEKVDKNGPTQPHMTTPCWLWTGAVTRNGYGSIGRGGRRGKTAYAHVIAHELATGPVPEGHMALHKCDVKLCVRHIYAGTHQDNMDDRQARGRTARAERSGLRTNADAFPKGSARGHAKLTEEQVRAIRVAVSSGVTQRALAAKYGVSSGLVCNIVQRKTWKHVGEAT